MLTHAHGHLEYTSVSTLAGRKRKVMSPVVAQGQGWGKALQKVRRELFGAMQIF